MRHAIKLLCLTLLMSGAVGCHPMNYTDQGTLLGGATGAGVGALIGEATGGNAGPGALIGAGVGAIAGNFVGNGLDEVEARNRAQIAAQMGRQIPPGGVQPQDIIAMTSAGVDEELIVNHIRANGVAVPLQAQDVIALQQQGVSKGIIAALQTSPRPQMSAPPVAVPMAPQPMMMAQPYYYPQPVYYGPPPWRPAPSFYYSHGHGHHRSRSSIGFAFSN